MTAVASAGAGPAAPAALLLSGSLGMGHDVMAEACAASLQRRGWSTRIVDSMALLGSAAGRAGERVFRGLLATPGAYDAFHFEQLRQGGRLARYAEKAAVHRLAPALRAELERRPCELVVSVFATGAAATSAVKQEYPRLRSMVLCTDVCPHRLWVHDNTDLFLVTTATAARFVRKFAPTAHTVTVPAPVRAPFLAAPSRATARAELGVPPDARCVLLMTGSWALGPLRAMAAALVDSGVHVLVVAGRNERLAAQLRRDHETHPQLIPFGYTDRVPTLMGAADLVVTTSGDTCSEARAVGRPLLLLDLVPGHGRENLQQELERGAEVAPAEPAALTRSVLARLASPASTAGPAARPQDAAQRWEDGFARALEEMRLPDTAAAGGTR